jgi:DNA-directed RNA polymerase subunit RPC12/RpoP
MRIRRPPGEPSNFPLLGSRAVSSGRTAVATYSCPNCRAELEAEQTAWDGWLRCPACGRVSLPPDPVIIPSDTRPEAAAGTDNGESEPAFAPGQAAPLVIPKPAIGRMAHTSPARLIFTTGLVLCLLLTLIAFIDQKPVGLGIFGFLSIVFFLLLLRTPRKRIARAGSWWSGQKSEPETNDPNEG